MKFVITWIFDDHESQDFMKWESRDMAQLAAIHLKGPSSGPDIGRSCENWRIDEFLS